MTVSINPLQENLLRVVVIIVCHRLETPVGARLRKVWRKVRASYVQPPLGAILCFPAWNLAKQRFDQISNGILRTPKVVPHPGSGRKVFWPQLDLRIGVLS